MCGSNMFYPENFLPFISTNIAGLWGPGVPTIVFIKWGSNTKRHQTVFLICSRRSAKFQLKIADIFDA